MAKAVAKASIDELFNNLDDILNKMEQGQLSLEETFELYNEGLKVVKSCNSQIDKIEKQLIVLQQEDVNE